MILANLLIVSPAWLAAGLVVSAALVAAVRSRQATHRVAAVGLTLTSTLVFASLMLWIGEADAHILLALCAVAGGAWLIWELLRRQGVSLSAERRLVLLAVRTAAWFAVLMLLARPAWDQTHFDYERPLLVVLIDHSASMELSDANDDDASAQQPSTRAERLARTLRATTNLRAQIAERYEVRVHAIGSDLRPLKDWRAGQEEPLTAIAGALRAASRMRAANGTPPTGVLLISDGAENTADAVEVLAAAAALADADVRLLTVSVGAASTPDDMLQLDPLVVPAKAPYREMLRVPVVGRVNDGAVPELQIDLLWNGERVGHTTPQIDVDTGVFRSTFTTTPPAPGAHRLTARAYWHGSGGPRSAEVSTVVEAVDDVIRVLQMVRVPRTETGAVVRVLRGDPQLEVTQAMLFDTPPTGAALDAIWSGVDVIILDDVWTWLPDVAWNSLRTAVVERGAGLLVYTSGLQTLTDDPGLEPLRAILPASIDDVPESLGEFACLPTRTGQRHPILAGIGDAVWSSLPRLAGESLGTPRPAAAVLVSDDVERSLVVGHEAGRGRVVALGLRQTWPWALASDAGRDVHERFWRQTVVWLANRRPRAWVISDRHTYALHALQSGRRSVAITADVTGAPSDDDNWGAPTLTVRPRGDETQVVQLTVRRRHGRWLAEYPPADTPPELVLPGIHELEFSVPATDGTTATLTATGRFEVVDIDLERRPPTADPDLLLAAAIRTQHVGGLGVTLAELPGVLQALAEVDDRRRVERVVRYDVVTRDPWGLYVWLVALFALEWVFRKRWGLP